MSNGSRRFQAAVCAALSLLLLCVTAAPVSAETLEELRERQKVLEQQKEENDGKLEELRRDTDEKREERDALYGQIDKVQGQLDQLRRQIEEIDLRIARAEDGIAEKQSGVDRSMDLLKERIKALYVTGDASALSVVLGSRDLIDFSEKLQFLRSVTAHDQELIRRLTDQLKDMQDELERISADKKELSDRKKELDGKSAELTELYQKAQLLLENAENQELYVRTNSELLGSRMAENEEAIAALEEELRRQGSGGSGYVGTGNFIWPMPGYTYLTCYFGDGGHRGIDIAGGDIYGQPIVAADGGTVLYAGWNDSYGWCVFIDHGNGFETRYAHMSELGTESGAAVEQGQVIGYVGSTGNSTGPHLHFEVICGGELTNPMGYF